jgi:cysteine desulfurase / selenocysteine lyase
MKRVTQERPRIDAYRCGSAVTRREVGRGALLAWFGVLAQSDLASPSEPKAAHGGVNPWRRDFPVLNQVVNGHPLVYLDSAATTQRPTAVIEAIAEFYRHDNANPGATLHTLARRAFERYEGARQSVARFLNAAQPDEIVWTRGSTEGINLVATAWARPLLRRGDEILLTFAEHASNLLPWRLVAEQTGAMIRYVEVDEDGRILLEDLDHKLSSRTKLVCFSHVSNVAGYINPAAEITARAHKAGARVLIDAAQSAPHIRLDVRALGCDFLVFSGHKILGPMGAGVLFGRRELLEQMPPYQSGSNMAHGVDVDAQEYEHASHKFSAGTPNVSGAVGLAAALRYLSGQDRAVVDQHESQLTKHALERLAEIPGLRVLGPRQAEQRVPVFSFVIKNQSPQTILRYLDSEGIAVRAGDLAALPLLKRFGVSAAVRASCHLYTQPEEIDRLVTALHELTRSGAQES